MPISLDQIVAATRFRVASARSCADSRELERWAQEHAPRGFRRALDAKSKGGVAVIAELKKASPSRGLIRGATEFESAGASALSVLTDEDFFQGSLENLRKASANTKLPCLRKDFIIDEFQLLEARANSADAILLIVAALSSKELVNLVRRAADLDLDVLCEVHDEEEIKTAVDAGCSLIGVNNRDLKTFKVDLGTAFRLAPSIPKNILGVAESGISSGADIARLRAAGFKAFLIGESLMKARCPGEALREVLAEASAPVSG
jgi:indole-3-glycerol phosphate synthase